MIVQSHLLQMRGLKHNIVIQISSLVVASFTDAWIETTKISINKVSVLVASFTDAWIETWVGSFGFIGLGVASFTDAWIETCKTLKIVKENGSRIFYRCVD